MATKLAHLSSADMICSGSQGIPKKARGLHCICSIMEGERDCNSLRNTEMSNRTGGDLASAFNGTESSMSALGTEIKCYDLCDAYAAIVSVDLAVGRRGMPKAKTDRLGDFFGRLMLMLSTG